MKKVLAFILALMCIQTTLAASDAAHIKIKISGAMHDNRYFLCLPNVGCLSILAAQKGKVFPVFRPIEMDNMFINDVNNNFHLTPQGLPSSCNVTVKPNQTISIYGRIAPGPGKHVRVNQLRCTVS